MQAARRKMLRQATATFGALLVILYLIGGMSGVRRLRARYRAWTEPPTAAELARAGPDTAVALPAAVIKTPDGRVVPLGAPATVSESAGIIVVVMILALILMFISARERTEH